MKEFERIEIEKGYEDSPMILSISMGRDDYEDFEWACRHNHEKPTELLREFMETYAYAEEEDKLEEKDLENFMKKGIEDKLIALYMKLCKVEKRLDMQSVKETTGVMVSCDSEDEEDLPFK